MEHHGNHQLHGRILAGAFTICAEHCAFIGLRVEAAMHLGLHLIAIKESLNNAIKHSGTSEISFQLKVQPTSFTFIIKDDGRGFDPSGTPADDSRISSGHGLRNIVHRLQSIGGTATISSEAGTGTTVELILSLNQNRNSIK